MTETLPSLRLVPKTDEKLVAKDFKSDQEVRWCPGCGDYAILAAVQGLSLIHISEPTRPY